MRYLIVLQGAAANDIPDDAEMVVAGQDGRVTDFSKEFYHVSQHEPGLLPGDIGPVTVLLIL
jgi:hypothetical protein